MDFWIPIDPLNQVTKAYNWSEYSGCPFLEPSTEVA